MRMSYDRIGNTRVRDNGKKVCIFTKVRTIKEDLKALLPEVKDDGWIAIFSHCRNFYRGNLHYGRRGSKTERPRELTEVEKQVYDYLLKNNLNPCTTYRWMLAVRIPDDIKTKLAQGRISHKKALHIAANRKRVKNSNQGLLLMEELKAVFRGL
jgi:hypothetical protein